MNRALEVADGENIIVNMRQIKGVDLRINRWLKEIFMERRILLKKVKGGLYEGKI